MITNAFLLFALFLMMSVPCAGQNKIFVVHTDDFSRPHKGILRLVSAMDDVIRAPEELQTAYDERVRQSVKPIRDEIIEALREYARKRGIRLLMDGNEITCEVSCPREMMGDMDITDEFISEYDRLHPAPCNPTSYLMCSGRTKKISSLLER